jgi:S-DNA-T family DNA segregation ATPase FtsK/SpoIIIE
MAKKKKNKNKNSSNGEGLSFPSFSIASKTKRLVLAVLCATFALVFVFAFFDKAGAGGHALFSFSQELLGKGVFLVPLLLVIAAYVLITLQEGGARQVFLSLFLLLLGIDGALGGFARMKGLDVKEIAGLLGSTASFPVFSAFGFWVAELLFGAMIAVSLVILWQLFPKSAKEKITLKEESVEKFKKVFEEDLEAKSEEPSPEKQPPFGRSPVGREKPPKAIQLGDYKLPPLDLLDKETGEPNAGDIKIYSAIVKKTLQNFDIPVEIAEVNIGPTVTQYAFKPAEGVKLSRITALQNDLALALAAHPLRIEAPIPGKALVGIEIPNKIRAQVRLRDLLESEGFKNSPSPLTFALGRDVSGSPIIADLARMPHLMVAGATGSGKTIALNNLILSLLYRNSPSQLRFILVDPKRVEFPVYNDLPHLLTPVILDIQRTLNALRWLIKEMERRFQLFSKARARDIKSYRAMSGQEPVPYIVLIIDELADLMATRGKEIEGMIVRLAQMARAVGIHLVLATQRPSVEVLTGLIKANITARVAFQVASQVDSRTILDGAGAEKLLGLGDMLFLSAEFGKPKRIQGAYISDKEVKRVVGWITKENQDASTQEIEEDELAQSAQNSLEISELEGDDDPLYEEAKRVAVEYQKASASLLQRRLKVGYARAARLLDLLEQQKVIGPGDGAKPREVYVAREKGPLEFSEQENTEGSQEGKEDSRWFTP